MKLLLALVWSVVDAGVVHLDIEPHSLPEWSTSRSQIATEWLDLLRQIEVELADDCTLTVDVAMSYSTPDGVVEYQDASKPLLGHVLDIVDSVVVLAYRNHAGSCEFGQTQCPAEDSILSHTRAALEIAASYPNRSKAVGVGVETNPDLLAKITFGSLEAGEEAMEDSLDRVVQRFAGPSGDYPGVNISLAVHDYTHYNSEEFLDTMSGERWCRSMWVWDEALVAP